MDDCVHVLRMKVVAPPTQLFNNVLLCVCVCACVYACVYVCLWLVIGEH